MLTSFGEAGLALRVAGHGSRRMCGVFPYKHRAVLSDGGRDGGRLRKEVTKSGAFSYRINLPEAEILILSGQADDTPVASRQAGTRDIKDTSEVPLDL